MKEPIQISKKIKDFSHTEFNSEEYTDLKLIKERIKNLQDPIDNMNLQRLKLMIHTRNIFGIISISTHT